MDFDEFKDKAAKLLNINLSGYKIKRVKRRTDSLMRRWNITNYQECLHKLKSEAKFKAAYINHFTINTSEFYRNPEGFNYLQEEILPDLFSKEEKVKIWSAPCSNGSEPYTIAIILKEMGISKSRFEVLASDLDPDILDTARQGIYGPNSLENVPQDILDKYFKITDSGKNKYQLKTEIKKMVTFEKKDLINEEYTKDWNLILSRNFFIYLTREIKDKLTHKFVDVLKPGGYFFLGNTEFIFNPARYGLKKEKHSFYQKA